MPAERNRQILLLFAHPDDETIICGATIAKYAKAGIPITLVCATKGEEGRRMGNPPFTTREELPKVREQELRDACDILGIKDLRFLGIRDKALGSISTDQLAQRIAPLLDELCPSVVVSFTEHSVYSNHPDHLAMARAAKVAFEQWVSRHSQHLHVQPRLFGVISSADASNPARIFAQKEQITRVFVEPTLRQKMLAFRAHRSQSEQETWLWKLDEKVMRKFSRYEYFLQLSPPYRQGDAEWLNLQ